jgi:hypothetical protein
MLKPLLTWALIVAVAVLALLTYGCKERPVQIGTSQDRSA